MRFFILLGYLYGWTRKQWRRWQATAPSTGYVHEHTRPAGEAPWERVQSGPPAVGVAHFMMDAQGRVCWCPRGPGCRTCVALPLEAGYPAAATPRIATERLMVDAHGEIQLRPTPADPRGREPLTIRK